MDKNHLRGIILKLQDCLSDNDRQRLHFFLGDTVPRQIRDDQTLNGTLRLMESLFDQDKINERDVTFLINTFNAIQCNDAVKILNEHMKRMQSNWLHKSTQSISPMIPSFIDQVIMDQEDKNSTQTFFHNQKKKNSSQNHKIINSNNTNINPLTITIDNKKILSSSSKQNQSFYISLITNKYFLLILLLFLIAFGILITLFFIKIKEINQLKNTGKVKDDLFGEQQRKNNQTVEKLNNRINEIENKKSIIIIKPGQKFGGTSGDDFNDSLLPDFTCHHLSAIGVYAHDDNIESYQFFYSLDNDNQLTIESQIHGNQDSKMITMFEFDKDEKIDSVEGQIINENIVSPNGTNLTISRITGLQFFSTKGRASLSYNGQLGQTFTENFDQYTLGYVTGKATHYINQLQFFWYPTDYKC
ncbi:unnamed protein product [Rotaria sordida]|uniref:Jacalin-type lectin domain-containing protein n=1 Tax=Rotaria sordida TaxID=392033 RepID=A0A819M6W3_9BILA|nr:unnamed protein product [Rotaria sordida]